MFSSFSKKNIVLSTAVVLSLGLIGCGSGGNGSSGTAIQPVKKGVFLDAPVEGLSYKTETQSGFTDANGSYKYKEGETVEFKLGTLVLGRGKAGEVVTPYTIADNNNTATNIALVLQNFDDNKTNKEHIDVSKLSDYNFTADPVTSDLNLTVPPSVLENKVSDCLATGSFQKHIDDRNHDLITENEAKKNMDDYIQKHKSEYLKDRDSRMDGNSSMRGNKDFEMDGNSSMRGDRDSQAGQSRRNNSQEEQSRGKDS